MKRIIGVFIITCFLAIPASAQSAEELFQQALTVERSSGNFEAAIALYEQVAAAPGAERRLTAKALIQIGLAYENLGRSEAEAAYSRVISEFADLQDLAAEAQAGVRRVSSADARQSITERRPFSTTSVDLYGGLEPWGSAVSPSGRYFAAVAQDGSIVQVDLETDQRTILLQGGSGWTRFVRFSPDESELAFSWFDNDAGEGAVKIINLETGDIRTAIDFKDYYSRYHNFQTEGYDTYVLDWTEDNSSLLVFVDAGNLTMRNQDGTIPEITQMLMVPLDGSMPRVIAEDAALDRWSYNGACLAGKDQYVMTDYSDRTQNWIQRIDVQSGVQVPWRKEQDVMIYGTACPADSDKVIYKSEYLSTPFIMGGDAANLDAVLSEETIISIESGVNINGFTNDADLLLSAGSGGYIPFKMFAVDANPSLATLESMQTTLDESSRAAMGAWDPSGNRFSWTVGNTVTIWSRETGEISSFYPEEQKTFWRHNRWFPDGSKIGVWGTLRGSQTPTFSVLDLENGGFAEPINGLEIKALGADGNSVIVRDESDDAKCYEQMDLTTRKRTPFFCVEGGPHTGISIREYHDYSKYLFSGNTTGFGSSLGVVNADGTDSRVVLEASDDRGVLGRFRWSSPRHLAFVRLSPDYRSSGMGPIERVDIQTGEISPIYGSIFSSMFVHSYHISPDGETVILTARPLKSTDNRRAYIMHNLLAEVENN